jgi:ElaB/YqjD/DUF883 family membrane-anchored ribosome-binding protein
VTSEQSSQSPARPAEPPAGDMQALQADIERTREQLGETVQALAAKADVKTMAKKKAAAASSQLKDRVQVATRRVAEQARRLQPGTGGSASGPGGSDTRAQAAAAAAAAILVLLAGWLRGRRRSQR